MRKALIPENRFGQYFFYAIGEIVLIMAGILLALQVNEWNQTRKNRIEEKLILDRLNKELNSNSDRLFNLLNGIERKESALVRVAAILNGKPIVNDSIFLSDVVTSSLWGWTIQPLQRLVFEEINNNGKLVLIQNTELRKSISELYNFIEIAEGTALVRTGNLSKIVYAIIPRENETSISSLLTHAQMNILTKKIIDSNIDQTIVYEQNRSKYLKEYWNRFNESISRIREAIDNELIQTNN